MKITRIIYFSIEFCIFGEKCMKKLVSTGFFNNFFEKIGFFYKNFDGFLPYFFTFSPKNQQFALLGPYYMYIFSESIFYSDSKNQTYVWGPIAHLLNLSIFQNSIF